MNQKNPDPVKTFEQERLSAAESYQDNVPMKEAAQQWLIQAFRNQYMYNYTWTGRPIIQLPADIIAFQEIVWAVKPDLIIETGIAHGGSLMLSASMLALLDYCEAIEQKKMLNPQKPARRVLGIDIDIRQHNRVEIETHPLSNRIDMIEGSSVAEKTVLQVQKIAANYSKILVCLDSNHTHDHALQELEHYAPLVSQGSYCLVFDTVIEDLPTDMFPGKPWYVGNNSKTAVHAFLERLKSDNLHGMDGRRLQFDIDQKIQNKLLISAMPDGILKRI